MLIFVNFQFINYSETISQSIFYFVQRQMEQIYEMLNIDKSRIPFWSRKLHLALKAYQVGLLSRII